MRRAVRRPVSRLTTAPISSSVCRLPFISASALPSRTSCDRLRRRRPGCAARRRARRPRDVELELLRRPPRSARAGRPGSADQAQLGRVDRARSELSSHGCATAVGIGGSALQRRSAAGTSRGLRSIAASRFDAGCDAGAPERSPPSAVRRKRSRLLGRQLAARAHRRVRGGVEAALQRCSVSGASFGSAAIARSSSSASDERLPLDSPPCSAGERRALFSGFSSLDHAADQVEGPLVGRRRPRGRDVEQQPRPGVEQRPALDATPRASLRLRRASSSRSQVASRPGRAARAPRRRADGQREPRRLVDRLEACARSRPSRTSR